MYFLPYPFTDSGQCVRKDFNLAIKCDSRHHLQVLQCLSWLPTLAAFYAPFFIAGSVLLIFCAGQQWSWCGAFVSVDLTSRTATSLPLSLFTPLIRNTKYTTQNKKYKKRITQIQKKTQTQKCEKFGMTSQRATSLPLSLFTTQIRNTKYTTQNNKNTEEKHKNAKSKRQDCKQQNTN